MKTFKHLLTAILVVTISTFSNAQEAKLHLKDFTPKYRIDTFGVKGKAMPLKRQVINTLKIRGIKTAFWDEESNVVTVQYNNKFISLHTIKSLFAEETLKAKEEAYTALVSCCN